ncbi:MAG: hypothetical protein LBN36_04665 [Clostridiales Family XIII bacterium]|jgi:hypothetical protein|nr:hypothetical protein [Clostridiales Family XIII bacterium]
MNVPDKVKKAVGDDYSFEMLMNMDEIYAYVQGQSRLWADKKMTTMTAGCLRIDAVFLAANEEQLPVFLVYVKESPEAKDWYVYGSPAEEVFEIDDTFELQMLGTLDRFREKHGLSYTEPDFEMLSGMIVKESKKPDEDANADVDAESEKTEEQAIDFA